MAPRRPVKLAAALLAPLVVACGAPPAAQSTPAPSASLAAPPSTSAPAPPASGATVVTYTEISNAWVEERMIVDPAAAKAWAADAANAKLVLPTTRHVLVKIVPARKDATEAAARKRAEAALARIRRGEDFAAVARAVSEDPGSKDNGGAYPGHMVELFIEPYVTAYRSLAPGEVTKQLVRTIFGFHIIKKDLVDDAAIAAAYRRSQAPVLARRLAGDLAARWRAPHAELHAGREIETAVRAVLGIDCACDDKGPRLVVVPVDKITPRGASTCAKVIATPRGESKILEQTDGVIVTKSGDQADVDERVKQALDVEPEHARWGTCTPENSDGGEEGQKLTPEQLRQMIEEMQRRKKTP